MKVTNREKHVNALTKSDLVDGINPWLMKEKGYNSVDLTEMFAK